MIHDPLLNIDRLREKARGGEPLSNEDWRSIRGDMNDAVCFFLRLQERGAFKGHESIGQEIELFLNSKDA